MSVKILRWMLGSGGDTIINLLLKSNINLHSQNKYCGLNNSRTSFDVEYVKAFRYDQISKMTLVDAQSTDINLLSEQLNQLEQEDTSIDWILKTHCYFEFNKEVIDIVIGENFLPFALTAGLAKNPRSKVNIVDYHPLISKISDSVVLYKFDCYNMAVKSITTKNFSTLQIQLGDLLKDWQQFTSALSAVGLYVSPDCQEYYERWLTDNKKFLPSKTYTTLVRNKNYDYLDSTLSIEEKYCLLALSGEKFRLLN
jgi:hypothetical protein